MEFPIDPKPSNEEMIDSYVKTLAQIVGRLVNFSGFFFFGVWFRDLINVFFFPGSGSEEEAKKKIYSVSTTTYTGFGALISEELTYKVKGNRVRFLRFRV